MRRMLTVLGIFLFSPLSLAAQQTYISAWTGKTTADTGHAFAPSAEMTAYVAKDSVTLVSTNRLGVVSKRTYARRASDSMRTVLVDTRGLPVAEMVHMIQREDTARARVTTLLRTPGAPSVMKRTIAVFPQN